MSNSPDRNSSQTLIASSGAASADPASVNSIPASIRVVFQKRIPFYSFLRFLLFRANSGGFESSRRYRSMVCETADRAKATELPSLAARRSARDYRHNLRGKDDNPELQTPCNDRPLPIANVTPECPSGPVVERSFMADRCLIIIGERGDDRNTKLRRVLLPSSGSHPKVRDRIDLNHHPLQSALYGRARWFEVGKVCRIDGIELREQRQIRQVDCGLHDYLQ